MQANTQIIALLAGVQLVYFRRLMAQEKEKVVKVLAGIGGAGVLDRERLDALGCHDNRSGDLIVSPCLGTPSLDEQDNVEGAGKFLVLNET